MLGRLTSRLVVKLPRNPYAAREVGIALGEIAAAFFIIIAKSNSVITGASEEQAQDEAGDAPKTNQPTQPFPQLLARASMTKAASQNRSLLAVEFNELVALFTV